MDESHIVGKVVDLGSNKLVTVSPYQGKILIDIREYYRDRSSSQRRPGKKGIALNCQQFDELSRSIHRIQQHIDRCRQGQQGRKDDEKVGHQEGGTQPLHSSRSSNTQHQSASTAPIQRAEAARGQRGDSTSAATEGRGGRGKGDREGTVAAW